MKSYCLSLSLVRSNVLHKLVSDLIICLVEMLLCFIEMSPLARCDTLSHFRQRNIILKQELSCTVNTVNT